MISSIKSVFNKEIDSFFDTDSFVDNANDVTTNKLLRRFFSNNIDDKYPMKKSYITDIDVEQFTSNYN